jgi:hypothetical protein
MGESLAEVRSAVEAFTSRFDARLLSAADASRLLRDATAICNMVSTVAALAASREAECGKWRREGARSPAEYVAKQTGVTVGAAADALRAAEQLESLPAVAEAARRGSLSPQQVAAVTSAAVVAPAEQNRLVADAGRLSLKELVSECGATRAAHTDAEALRAKHQRERSLHTWTDAEGLGHLRAQGPAERIAAIATRITAERDRIFEAARKDGRCEPPDAYGFDALEAICLGEAAAATVKHKVIVRVDLDTLLRGQPSEGETCDVAGTPVAVSVVEDILASGSAFLSAVLTKGETITGVLHLGRAPTAKQQTGLEWLYPTCAAEGCSQSARLQRDHREDWARTKVTLFDLLDLLCPLHHGLKTTKGYGLVKGRGKRAFVAPTDVRHPQHSPPDAA